MTAARLQRADLRQGFTVSSPHLVTAGMDAQNGVVLTGITRTEGANFREEPRGALPGAAPSRGLILRRGLAAAAAIAVLALGVVIKLVTSKH